SVGRLRRREALAKDDSQRLRATSLSSAHDPGRWVAQGAGAICARDDDCAGAVTLDTAIEQSQRVGDDAGSLVIRERYWRPHHRARVEASVPAQRNRNGAKLLACRAVFDHVAPGEEPEPH